MHEVCRNLPLLELSSTNSDLLDTLVPSYYDKLNQHGMFGCNLQYNRNYGIIMVSYRGIYKHSAVQNCTWE